MNTYDVLNSLLVKLFRDIIVVEEKSLITDEFKDITVNDMHIIEAIGNKEPRTMSTIAKSLHVTMGTLTTGINGLVKKGYAVRIRSEKDRRIVYASLTPKGIKAFKKHANFHIDLVNSIIEGLSDEDASVLTAAFTRLDEFFTHSFDD